MTTANIPTPAPSRAEVYKLQGVVGRAHRRTATFELQPSLPEMIST
ncbi:hypothetical protein ACFVKB_47145 [Rhodococcus sp. NPDC127530]